MAAWQLGVRTFNSTVQAVLNIFTNTPDPNDQQNSGTRGPINFVLANQPMTHVPSLTLPIGTNNSPAAVEAILNLPPSGLGVPNTAAYQPTNQIYLFNECDLIISNFISGTNCMNGTNGSIIFTNRGTNMAVFYSDQGNSTTLVQLTNDLLIPKTTNCAATNLYAPSNILYAGYSFVTNVAFYDYRESSVVQAVQIDVSKLNTWLTNSQGSPYSTKCNNDKGHPIDSIYVYNNASKTSKQLPAVRVVNGQQLPSSYGLTIATPQPLYVQGNYNMQTNSGGGSSAGTTTPPTPIPPRSWPMPLPSFPPIGATPPTPLIASYANRDPVQYDRQCRLPRRHCRIHHQQRRGQAIQRRFGKLPPFVGGLGRAISHPDL